MLVEHRIGGMMEADHAPEENTKDHLHAPAVHQGQPVHFDQMLFNIGGATPTSPNNLEVILCRYLISAEDPTFMDRTNLPWDIWNSAHTTAKAQGKYDMVDLKDTLLFVSTLNCNSPFLSPE
jgi:hypothetical protein